MKKDYKRCPRCGQKMHSSSPICPECNLKFNRIENLSNSEAKKALKNGEKEKVIYVTTPPADVNMKKFYYLYIFLGLLGIYNIYIGKIKRGLFSLISVSLYILIFILRIVLEENGIDTTSLNYYVFGPIGFVAVFGALIWFIDLASLLSRSFKFPGALSNDDYVNYLIKSKTLEESGKRKDVANTKIKKSK